MATRRKRQAAHLKQSAPSTWFLKSTKRKAAEALVEWNDECILANISKASRAYLYGSAYEGYTLTSLSSFGVDVRSDLVMEGLDVPVYVNRVRAQAQTFVSKTGANDDPVPQFVTNDGDYEQRRKAELLDGTIGYEYTQQQGGYPDFHALCRKLELLVTSALGRGWVFVFPKEAGGRMKPEAEIDDGLTIGLIYEQQFGRIIGLSRSVWMDPEAAISRWPKHKEHILANVELVQPDVKSGAALPHFDVNSSVQPTRRQVRIVQGWHISTGKDDPGREMFTLKDATWLEDNEWTRHSPPGRHIDYDEELSSEGGTPLTHTIYRMFCRENELIHDMDNLERNMPMETWLTQKGTGEAQDVKDQLEHATGIKILEISGDVGSAVKVADMKGLPRKGTELLALYADRQHEVTGVSRGHQDGAQPKHVSSGIQASLEASLFPERHADFMLRFNRFRAVDCAELFVWALQDIIESGERFAAWAGDEDIRQEVRGEDLDLDLTRYRMEIKASSERKDSPATRLEKAERWLQDPTVDFTGQHMAEFWKSYDVDHFAQQLTAITDGVTLQIKRWRSLPLAKALAAFKSPPKYYGIEGLQSALRTVVADYEEARQSDMPQERLDIWETYMNQCVALIRELRLDEAKLVAQAQQEIGQNATGRAATAGRPEPGGGQPPGGGAAPQG